MGLFAFHRHFLTEEADDPTKGTHHMTHFFVDNNAQPDGAHEVHAVGCKRMATDKRYLGDFMSCEQASFEARKEYWQTAPCVRCMDPLSPSESARLAQLLYEFIPIKATGT